MEDVDVLMHANSSGIKAQVESEVRANGLTYLKIDDAECSHCKQVCSVIVRDNLDPLMRYRSDCCSGPVVVKF